MCRTGCAGALVGMGPWESGTLDLPGALVTWLFGVPMANTLVLVLPAATVVLTSNTKVALVALVQRQGGE